MNIMLRNKKEYEVLKKIEILRKQMIQTGIHQGFTSEETLNVSRKLDSYIKRYLFMKKSN